MNAATRSAVLSFAALAAALGLSSCSSTPQGTEPAGTPTQPDATAAANPAANAEATGGPAATGEQPTPVPKPLLQRLELENGLDVMLLRHEATLARTAEIGVRLAGGTEHGAPGIADLALHVLCEGADLTAGRLPLQKEIERLGGTLTVELGRRSTWIAARVPQESWQRAARALGAALRAEAPGRSAIERARQELVDQRATAIAAAPVDFAAQRLLLGDASPSAHLQSLQDRDPTEAATFLASHFGAREAVLALRVPATLAAQVETAKKEFGGWAAGTVGEKPNGTARATASGIAWIADPDAAEFAPCEVALVQQLPAATAGDAVVLTLLADCVTLQGIGGRLERLLQEAGLGRLDFVPHVETLGESEALVLRTALSRDQVQALWQAAQNARRSLRELAPTLGERTQARAAALLASGRDDAVAGRALHALVDRQLAGLDDAAMAERATAAERASALDAKTIDAYLALPFGLVVRGPAMPTGLADARACELLPSDRRAPAAATPNDAMLAAALPWRDRAVAAIGEPEQIERVVGLAGARRIATEGAPDVDETFMWTAAGDLERSRTVLGSAIETRLRERTWTERVADKEVQLDVVEAAWRRLDAERHPLAILAAWQQGRLHFRLLTTRTAGDREHVVLEAVDAGMERLRIEIDAGSNLLRVVESWARSPEGTASHTVDQWSDYRTIDGIRVPFRCATKVDDGQSLRISTFGRVQPTLR